MAVRQYLFIGALILAVGCGGSGSSDEAMPGASGESSDAEASGRVEGCAVLTQEQVSAALGAPVGAGEDSGLTGCAWRAESGARVSLQIYAGSTLVAATCDAQKFLVSGREEEVPGLGDSALWGSSGDLVVCTSRAVLKVDVDNTRSDPRQDREVLVQIARLALGRI